MNREMKLLIGRCQRLDAFIERNPALWDQSITQQFIKEPHHRKLIIAALCHPTKCNKDKLDQTFYAFYGEMKLTSYIMKTLYWRAIRFDQQVQQRKSQHPLILDQPLDSEESITIADSLIETNTSNVEEGINSSLQDLLPEKAIYLAFNHLTARQETILNKSYKEGWSDTEVARHFGITQQAVFKTRQTALNKIRDYLQRWESD